MLLAFHMGVCGDIQKYRAVLGHIVWYYKRIGTTVPNCPGFCSHSSCLLEWLAHLLCGKHLFSLMQRAFQFYDCLCS